MNFNTGKILGAVHVPMKCLARLPKLIDLKERTSFPFHLLKKHTAIPKQVACEKIKPGT